MLSEKDEERWRQFVERRNNPTKWEIFFRNLNGFRDRYGEPIYNVTSAFAKTTTTLAVLFGGLLLLWEDAKRNCESGNDGVEELQEEKSVSRSKKLVEKINAMSEKELRELDKALEDMEILMQNMDKKAIRELFQNHEESEIGIGR